MSYYSKFLIGLNKVSEAIEFLDPKNSPKEQVAFNKAIREWKLEDYINRNNEIYVEMSQYLYRNKKKKE